MAAGTHLLDFKEVTRARKIRTVHLDGVLIVRSPEANFEAIELHTLGLLCIVPSLLDLADHRGVHRQFSFRRARRHPHSAGSHRAQHGWNRPGDDSGELGNKKHRGTSRVLSQSPVHPVDRRSSRATFQRATRLLASSVADDQYSAQVPVGLDGLSTIGRRYWS